MPRLLLPLFILCCSILSGQKELIYKSSGSDQGIEFIDLPELDNIRLQKEAATKDFGALRFAKKIEKKINCENQGTWVSLPNEKSLWRLRLRSKNATSLNLVFHKFVLPENSTLIIYDKEKEYVVGPFTDYDNNNNGMLWSPMIPYDDIILELQLPTEKKQNLQLEIGQINHGFIDHLSKSFSESCHLDVVCGAIDGFPEVEKYRDVIRSVGVYSIEGTRLCTGALINNTRNDCKPYFLTANHCGITNSNANSVVIHWNYENQTCRAPGSIESGTSGDGSLNLFNSGTKLISKYASTDFALVELDEDVPSEANAYFAGWNVLGINTDTTVCIHHPNVDEKRISIDYEVMDIYSDDPLFWIVNNWEIGSTESGSSGAPIFNTDSEIIGQIFGGQASCSNNLWDIFGRMDISWTGNERPDGRLKDWLDPLNTNTGRIGGKSCSALLDINEPVARICNTSSGSYSVILNVNDGFSGEASLDFENDNSGITVTLEKNTINSNTTSTVDIMITDQVPDGDYEIKFTATEGLNEAIAFLTIRIAKNLPEDITSISPVSSSTVGTNLDFEWEDDYEFYELEISLDQDFNSFVTQSPLLLTNTYNYSGLSQETKYFWRVRGINSCGTGDWSSFAFETGIIECNIFNPTDLPIAIDEVDKSITISRIEIPVNQVITDVNIQKIKGTHTWVGDLQFRILSPAGTEVTLLSQECDDNRNFDLGFDDESENEINCPINGGIIYKPTLPLSVFKDEASQGVWELQILDLEDFDGGSFDEWSLEVCTNISKTISSTEDIIADVINTYPNPTREILFIERNQNLKFPNYSIHNVAGTRMLSGELSNKIDVSQLSNGVYFLQIRDNKKLLGVKKLVISK